METLPVWRKNIGLHESQEFEVLFHSKGTEGRWLELVKDYDVEILYHLGKANVVAYALSRKTVHSAALITRQASLCKDFEYAGIAVVVGEVASQLAQLSVQPTLRQRIISVQQKDPYFVENFCQVKAGQESKFSMSSNDGLLF